MQICVCPNQHCGQIRVCLPRPLKNKWAKHIGDVSPRVHYSYCVAAAVREAKSTREHFSKCWKTYQRRAKNNGDKYFFADVFQRFCDADFAKKKGDNSEGKLAFVRRILEGNDDAEPSEVSYECVCWCVCVCVCVVILMYEYHHVQEIDGRHVCICV